MLKVKCSFIVLILVIGVTSAHAEVICKAQNPGIVTKKDKSGEFYSLVDKKMTAEAVMCCLACLVDPGTKVIVTDLGFVSHTIRVLEGESQGCVGDIPVESVNNCE